MNMWKVGDRVKILSVDGTDCSVAYVNSVGEVVVVTRIGGRPIVNVGIKKFLFRHEQLSRVSTLRQRNLPVWW